VSADQRTLITHDAAKTFIPLAQHFRALGYQVRPAAPDADAAEADRIAAHFACFYQTLKHPLRASLRFRAMRQRGIPVMTWNRDAPHYLNQPRWRLDLLERLRPFDLYATHSTIDGRHFGRHDIYLANAADTGRYGLADPVATLRRLRDSAQYRYDVSFFGSMDGDRYKEMRERQAFFTELGRRLGAQGIRFLFREAVGMGDAEQIELIHASRINLNFGAACDHGAAEASGLPERCFGIPACGGFLLCDKRRHARDDFTPGEDWAEFDGLDNCLAQIAYWMANFDAARDLAERCHAHVIEHHTYARRASQLLAALPARPGQDGEAR